MSHPITPDREQFLARLNEAVDAYITRMGGRRPQGTKTWLASQLGCERTTLYKYLDDTNRIPLETLHTLISVVGLSEDKANELLFLGGYGVAVPVVAPAPPAEPAITPTSLRAALAEALPGALDSTLADSLSLLTGLLSDLRKGQIVQEDLAQAVAADAKLSDIVRAFDGKRVQVGDKVISFDDAQAGNVTFGDVAGRDVINITIQAPPEPTKPGSLCELPPPLTEFVGRTEIIARVAQHLTQASSQGAAVAILRGMGGIGKTELATIIAYRLRAQFPDGQLVLDALGSSEVSWSAKSLMQQVIRKLLPEAALTDEQHLDTGQYRSLFHNRRVLLLVDDVRDAEQVEMLIPPEGSALLVTTRNRFPLRYGAYSEDLEPLGDDEATRLLDLLCPRLEPQQARQLAELCGNLPLALQMSAGRLASDGTVAVQAYLTQLSDVRLRIGQMRNVLTTNSRDMEAVFQTSYDLLDPAEQAALRRMSIFPTSFDKEAAQKVVDIGSLPPAKKIQGDKQRGRPAPQSFDDIFSKLYLQNWLKHDPLTQRFSLHAIVRAFAISHLDERDEGRQRRYAIYYAALLALVEVRYLRGGEHVTNALEQFDRERVFLLV